MFLLSSIDIDDHLPVFCGIFSFRYSPIKIEAG
jgi:hypothetical protein